ncbi:MAG TPA: paraquat-inducible protein A [Burkholderiales bacterium]|nr:paraquat-inducible protein A [Burkholderiales bacterium]
MSAPLAACHECDLLQREVPLPAGGVARCVRCGAELYRDRPHSLDRALALTAGALLLFAIANCFPILGLALQGQVINTTLYDTVDRLWDEDMKSVAALVFATTIAMPALELGALAYLLAPVRFGRLPPHFALVFRVLQAVRPWGMVEVLMLGVLVSLVKLAHLAGVVPGIALWSFGALMLVMAALAAVFDPRALWERAASLAQAGAAR